MQYPNSIQRADLLLQDCELNRFGAWCLELSPQTMVEHFV
jgi:hypothetical protein